LCNAATRRDIPVTCGNCGASARLASGSGVRSYDGAVAQSVILTVVFVAAAALGVWGALLAIRAVWIAVEFRVVDHGDGTAGEVQESYEDVRLRDYRRQRAKLPPWRRMATDAQLCVAGGLFVGCVGSVVWLWWP
jgi:hypothetical protein